MIKFNIKLEISGLSLSSTKLSRVEHVIYLVTMIIRNFELEVSHNDLVFRRSVNPNIYELQIQSGRRELSLTLEAETEGFADDTELRLALLMVERGLRDEIINPKNRNRKYK